MTHALNSVCDWATSDRNAMPSSASTHQQATQRSCAGWRYRHLRRPQWCETLIALAAVAWSKRSARLACQMIEGFRVHGRRPIRSDHTSVSCRHTSGPAADGRVRRTCAGHDGEGSLVIEAKRVHLSSREAIAGQSVKPSAHAVQTHMNCPVN